MTIDSVVIAVSRQAGFQVVTSLRQEGFTGALETR